jgi:hypothetical protein
MSILDKALACEFRDDGKWQMRTNGKLEAYPTSVCAIISAASVGLGVKRGTPTFQTGHGIRTSKIVNFWQDAKLDQN